MYLKTPPGFHSIVVCSDVVTVDVPPLLRLDVLDSESLVADTVINRLVHRTYIPGNAQQHYVMNDWSVPLKRIDDHVYVEMSHPSSVNFTRAQLEKIHKNFFHPTVDKLFNLIKRAQHDEATPETKQILE